MAGEKITVGIPGFQECMRWMHECMLRLQKKGIDRKDIVALLPPHYTLLWQRNWNYMNGGLDFDCQIDSMNADIRKVALNGCQLMFISPEDAAYVYWKDYSFHPEGDFHFKMSLGLYVKVDA